MEKCVFMESYNPALVHDGEIVSLEPSVSYRLFKNKIKYRILEDYYDEKMLWAYEGEYFIKQLKWFDYFDKFIKDNISCCKENNIPLAKASYLSIKKFTDTVIINSITLSQFFQNNPDLVKISYFNKPFGGDLDYTFFGFTYEYRKVFGDLLRLFCEKYNIQFVNYSIAKEKSSLKKNHFDFLIGKGFVKSQIKNIYNLIRYRKLKKIFSSNNYLKNSNFFLMHAGSLDIDYPIKEIIKHNGRVYVQEEGRVLREDFFLRSQVDVPVLNEYLSKEIEDQCGKCAENLRKDMEIIPWINDKCQMDVSSIVLPYFEHFISRDCSYILRDAKRMYDFYKQEDISYVFARGNTTREALGPLIAAKYMKGSKSICVQHASFALDIVMLGVFETETYNYIITRDDISQEFYEHSYRNRYNSGCKIVQWPYYLRSVGKRYCKNKKGGKVIYVQRTYPGLVRYFNGLVYPLAWYYEFQRELIDFFTEESSFDFIYKHGCGQEWAENSILRYIEDKGYENIDVSKKHFLKTLESADRVITDYPSSSFFEAAVSGKPVLCVCTDRFKVLAQAKTVFGKSLRQFSSIEEAKSIIKEFLYSDPRGYLVNIPMSTNNLLDVFKRMNAEGDDEGN